MFTSETHSQSYLEDYTVSVANHLVALIFYYLCSVRECLIIVLLVLIIAYFGNGLTVW